MVASAHMSVVTAKVAVSAHYRLCAAFPWRTTSRDRRRHADGRLTRSMSWAACKPSLPWRSARTIAPVDMLPGLQRLCGRAKRQLYGRVGIDLSRVQPKRSSLPTTRSTAILRDRFLKHGSTSPAIL
jgi:hypothetical protein